MNRTHKNIVMIVIAVLLAGSMVFTMHSAAGSLAGGFQGPPDMQGGPQTEQKLDEGQDSNNSGQSEDQDSGESSDQNGGQGADQAQGDAQQDPAQGNTQQDQSSDQSSDTNDAADQSGTQTAQKGAPPEKPEGDSGDNNNGPGGQPPTPPNGDNNGDSNSNGQPPEMPGNSSDSGSSVNDNTGGGQPPQMNGQPPEGLGEASISSISSPYYILFGAEGLAFALVLMYLIMSGMNRKTRRETLNSRKKVAAFLIASVLIGGCLVPVQAALTASAFAGGGQAQSQGMPGGPGNGQSSDIEATGATTVDGTEETLNDTYTSTNADENAILVTNGGTLISDGATINKESGDSSNTESSDFSGVNSGLLVQENSTATVTGAAIKTSAKGANAVFATGENAKISISDSTITTTGEASSRGLDATYGGTIEADNVTITTQGGSCAAMATDRGEGTVTATNSTLETNGAGSPVIYSTGDITLTDSTGTANGAQITVVEGKNSATIENSSVTCSGAGNRGDVDIAGVMIYQSMSGDADEGTGNFTAKDSTLSISEDSNYYKTAPMFFVTNTDAVIDLTNTELNFGSGVLLSACGTSEWGNEGSNGGNVTLNAADEKLTGDIQLDEISSLTMNLADSSYKGTINGDNEAASVALTLDEDSTLTLTGDSYVSSLEDADSSYSNIDFNGYTLYVDGEAVNN